MPTIVSLAGVLFGVTLARGAVLAARDDRAACTSDACGNAFTLGPGLKRTQQASSWCSSYMTAPPAETITQTATTTVPVGVVTITASPASTKTVTSYACPAPLKARDVETTPTWAASACTATGTVRAEQRLSSACSCMGITARATDPVVTTEYSTETGPVSTMTVTPTVTTTIVNPWNPSPTNLLKNGGFEEDLSHWSYTLSDSYTHVQVATPGLNSSQTVQIDIQSPGGRYGPAHFAGATLIQEIPPIYYSYDYTFSMRYRFTSYDRKMFSCTASLNASQTNLGYRYIYPGDGSSWDQVTFNRQASSSNPSLSGPMRLYVGCFWDLNESTGATMATLQIDNIEWVPVAGCHPL